MLKRIKWLIALSALALASCTSPSKNNDESVARTRSQIAAIEKVQIFYDSSFEIVAIDLGSSNLIGLSGLLGPIGMIGAVVAAGVSSAGVVDRTSGRTKELTAALKADGVQVNLHERFAESLGQHIRDSGKQAVLSALPARAKGKVPQLPEDAARLPGHAALVLRLSEAYGAPDATSSYRISSTVEQALYDTDGNLIRTRTFVIRENSPSYLTFASLMQSRIEAFSALDQALMKRSLQAYQQAFVAD